MTQEELTVKIDRLKDIYTRLSRLSEERGFIQYAVKDAMDGKYGCVSATLSGGFMDNAVNIPLPSCVFVEHAKKKLICIDREISELLKYAGEV